MKNYLIIGSVAALVIVLTLNFYFLWYNSRVNYLIPGVSYYGYYNHFLDIHSLIIASVADILGYWKDGRFSLADLATYFRNSQGPTRFITTAEIANFFKVNGYNVYRWTSDKPGDEIRQIKKYVNQYQKVPVIVYQKRSLLPDNQVRGFRVVIGVFDRDEKVIVHDYDFGNNFAISYADFNKLFLTDARAMVAVWPGADLVKNLKRPDYSAVYPERLPVMDKLGEYLIKGSWVVIATKKGENEKALKFQQQFINDEHFDYLPPIQKIFFYDVLANLYLVLNRPDEAIDIITKKALPLNHDLNRLDNGWIEQVSFFQTHGYAETKLAGPYFLLGTAYMDKGDKKSAKNNFEEALKIYPKHDAARKALDGLLKSAKK